MNSDLFVMLAALLMVIAMASGVGYIVISVIREQMKKPKAGADRAAKPGDPEGRHLRLLSEQEKDRQS
jgi:hypothetical protein